MHRFRKRSDAKRNQVPPEVQGLSLATAPREPLPVLPPASDFRTSLILPDLSRRFTLLRSSSGDPISLDDMRSRFAEQRAKGSENTISEEEEDMLFEALNRMRAENASASTVNDDRSSYLNQHPSSAPYATSDFDNSTARQSAISRTTSSSSFAHESSYVPASPSSRVNKRHSNNLFGSGQFRDVRYIRQATHRNGSSRSVLSVSPSETTTGSGANGSSYTYADSLRPTTPDSNTPSTSPISPPNDKTPMIRSAPLQPSYPFEASVNVTELRFSKPLTRMQIKRMSTSLEEVIRELEEDTDDKVLLPRSTSTQQPAVEDVPEGTALNSNTEDRKLSQTTGNEPNGALGATNWIAEDHPNGDTESRPTPPRSPVSASPVPRIPGYIPGMPRPMTPHEMDADDQRPNSTTPRATSPISTYDRSAAMSPISATGLLRRGSNASSTRQNPQSGSPMISQFTYRAENGRFTPEERLRSGELPAELGQPQDSSIIGRRRPASPLSGSAFQTMYNTSRPGTPSNVTWNVPSRVSTQKTKQPVRNGNGSFMAHSREGSSVSITDSYESAQFGSLERGKSLTRSLRSPPLPDSPLIDSGHASVDFKALNHSNASVAVENPASASPGLELGSPVVTDRILRSPTPTHQPLRSPLFSGNDPLRLNQMVASPLVTPTSSPFSPRLQNPLVYSPASNSSHSSLVSTGSSYHSWEEEHANESHGILLLRQSDRKAPAWHDLSDRDVPAFDQVGGPDGQLMDDSEVILRQFTGLTKSDLAAIQGKLLDAAQYRAKNTEPRVSALRRRRPSTTQSIQSIGGRESRTTSPAPQSPITASFARVSDNTAKANALLDSVVDSIQEPPQDSIIPIENESNVEVASPTQTEASSPTRRNKVLAEAIFGNASNDTPVMAEAPQEMASADPPSLPEISGEQPEPQSTPLNTIPQNEQTFESFATQQLTAQLDSPPRASPVDQVQLMRDVQEKVNAATAQLRKSPLQPKNIPPIGTAPRKRINPQDISSPRLFQSSTSIDKIPTISTPLLTSPVAHEPRSTSKIGSRIKKLRGTLRVKNPAPNGDEVSPWTLESATSPLDHGGRFNQQKTSPVTTITPPTSSTAELGRVKSSDPSPPASAGPSLKSFMSRFRKRGQTDSNSESDRRNNTPPPTHSQFASSLSPSSAERVPVSPPHSAPASNGRTFPGAQQPYPPQQSLMVTPPPPQTPDLSRPGTSDSHTSGSPTDQDALKKLYEAAGDLGLDHVALNEFLTRSQSTSSRSTAFTSSNGLTRNHSLAVSSSSAPRENLDRARSPTSDRQSSRTPDHSRKSSLLSPADSSAYVRRPRELVDGQVPGGNPVVRRTLIFPSGNGSNSDLATLVRKTSKKSRRTSGTSVQSARSVHDRVPTPPPPSRAKRFSVDSSPPVPRLPHSFSSFSQSGLLPAAESGIEKSSSTYESLYDMYAEDRNAAPQAPEVVEPLRTLGVETPVNGETDQAVEVIELANGETIWSIVNGLRSDDADSVYHRRISVASEFSNAPMESEEQLFFKEHARNTSKSSGRSFLSRKKGTSGQRPETKVFYSSSTQIARLIENLSRGADAGSFNIKPKITPGHSHSSSLQSETEMHWTVEERLEHMLGSMGASS